MKRMIAGISAATAVVLTTGAPAQARTAPADPVKALKSQFVPGKGVRFTDLTTMIEDGKGRPYLRRTGSFQFGRGGGARPPLSSKKDAPARERPNPPPPPRTDTISHR